MLRLKGIKIRLVGTYLFIIMVTVGILEVFLIFSVTQFSYKGLENSLENQIKVSVDIYNNYLSSSHLKKNVQDNADIFWKNTNAEVQVIDLNKKVLMNSIGTIYSEDIVDPDVIKALKGETSSFIYYDSKNKERLLSVSSPLKYEGKIEGVLRYVTTLKKIDKTVDKITFFFLALGLGVIIVIGGVGVFLSDKIVKPIKEVTDMAKRYTSGQLSERLVKRSDDEIGQLSETLNHMADQIIENDKLKNEFIASVSHELRTPLTSIKGWAATIRTGNLENKQEIIEGMEIIEKESDRLTELVEELLDFSKFVSGKVTLNRSYIDIRNTIMYVEKQMRHRATKLDLHFNINVQENLPMMLMDENRIKQVLINIIDNAFNFTESSGLVDLQAYRQGENLEISLEDSGIGIPEDEISMVTEKFYRGKSNKSKNGIGLSICMEIIKLHKGKLIITSKVNVGTKVIIRLPIEISSEKNI